MECAEAFARLQLVRRPFTVTTGRLSRGEWPRALTLSLSPHILTQRTADENRACSHARPGHLICQRQARVRRRPVSFTEAGKSGMSGPGGTTTRRDQRRDTRRAQFQQRQLDRQRERQRQLQRQRNQRIGIGIAGGLALILVVFLIVHAVVGAASPGANIVTGKGTYTTGVDGSPRDGMSCVGTEGAGQHIHSYLSIYVNGQPVPVTPNAGILTDQQCLYSLHVHQGINNVIHVESPDANAIYTLGAFFDIWGHPLTATSIGTPVGDYKVDKDHAMTIYIFDANGKQTQYKGNPMDIQLKAHETIVILYNSPNVTPKAFTNWGSL